MELIGPIPSEIGSIENLTALGLAGNGLTSTLPIELFNLSNLMNMNFGEEISNDNFLDCTFIQALTDTFIVHVSDITFLKQATLSQERFLQK